MLHALARSAAVAQLPHGDARGRVQPALVHRTLDPPQVDRLPVDRRPAHKSHRFASQVRPIAGLQVRLVSMHPVLALCENSGNVLVCHLPTLTSISADRALASRPCHPHTVEGACELCAATRDGSARVVEAALGYPQPQRSLPALETELRAPACAVRLAGVAVKPLQHRFLGRVIRSHAWALEDRAAAQTAHLSEPSGLCARVPQSFLCLTLCRAQFAWPGTHVNMRERV